MKNITINDDDRAQWVMNDEYLYRLFCQSNHRYEKEFAKKNREIIDEVITASQ